MVIKMGLQYMYQISQLGAAEPRFFTLPRNKAHNNTKRAVGNSGGSFCDSYRIQTCNLLIRSQMLYSVELRSRFGFICDSYRIQTCNLLIRSQMLYSVELRSLSGVQSFS